MSDTRLRRRLVRRTLHRSRSVAVSVALALLALGAAYLGLEAGFAAAGLAPLFVAPAEIVAAIADPLSAARPALLRRRGRRRVRRDRADRPGPRARTPYTARARAAPLADRGRRRRAGPARSLSSPPRPPRSPAGRCRRSSARAGRACRCVPPRGSPFRSPRCGPPPMRSSTTSLRARASGSGSPWRRTGWWQDDAQQPHPQSHPARPHRARLARRRRSAGLAVARRTRPAGPPPRVAAGRDPRGRPDDHCARRRGRRERPSSSCSASPGSSAAGGGAPRPPCGTGPSNSTPESSTLWCGTRSARARMSPPCAPPRTGWEVAPLCTFASTPVRAPTCDASSPRPTGSSANSAARWARRSRCSCNITSGLRARTSREQRAV